MLTYIKKCPECKSININFNKEKGEVICRDCGLVIEERMVDLGQEWREFDSDQEKRRRTGAPMSYSVSAIEPIIIKKGNQVRIVQIGEFIDELIQKKSFQVKKDGHVEYADITDEGYETVAFDKNHNISFKPIQEVSRHTTDYIYQMDLEMGKRICVTGSHSVFTVIDNEIVPVLVSELKEGDFVVAPKKLPELHNPNLKLNLLKKFIDIAEDHKNIYLRGIQDTLFFAKLKKLKKEYPFLKSRIKHWIRHKTIPLWVLNRLRSVLNIYDFNIEDTRIGIYSSSNELPLELGINEKLCRLLGFFASEGHADEHSIVFSFGEHESQFINEVKNIIRDLFNVLTTESKKHTSAVQIEASSKLLSLLFTKVFETGKNAKNKRVPFILYSLPKNLKLMFLRAYIDGDGSFRINNKINSTDLCISTSSVNKLLSNDIIYLWLQLDIHAAYREYFIKEHIIEKTGQLIKGSLASATTISDPNVAFRLGYTENRPCSNKPVLSELIPLPEISPQWMKDRNQHRISRNIAMQMALTKHNEILSKLATSDFIFLRITNIEKCKYTYDYVYDISVPECENFVGGRGAIFLHNTRYDRGLGTDIGQKGDIFQLKGKGMSKFFRLRKWQYRISTAIERNLKLALAELKRVASYLKLPKSVEEEAARIYTMAVQRGLVRGRSMESVVAGALYAACRRHEVPRTLDELSEASGIDKKEVGRTYRFVTRELGIRILPSNPVDYIPRFASALKLTAETQSKAVEILEMAEDSELTSGRGPTGIAAASLYVAALMNNEKRTQREVADIAGVTEVTIRNRYKELFKKLKLKDKLKGKKIKVK